MNEVAQGWLEKYANGQGQWLDQRNRKIGLHDDG
jgi:hypothetical protein